MNSAQFIRALQSADKKDFSYSIKNFNINETKPSPLEVNKSLSCSFVSAFRFGKAELILNQGVFIDYFSANGLTYQRKALHRIDYLDSILVNGFDDIEGGRFDLVFLLDQLDRQGIIDPHKAYKKISMMIDLMFEVSSIKKSYIVKLLLNAFDNYVMAMPDVEKLEIQGSHERFVEHLIDIKMSQLEPSLKEATYEVNDLSLEEPTNLHHFVSGNVTTRFAYSDCQFMVKYHMVRQYPVYTNNHQMLRVNNTNFDSLKGMDILGKVGEISLNLSDKDDAMKKLGGNSALFFKLQSIFGMVKRANSLAVVTDKFDHFYHNALVEQQALTDLNAKQEKITNINSNNAVNNRVVQRTSPANTDESLVDLALSKSNHYDATKPVEPVAVSKVAVSRNSVSEQLGSEPANTDRVINDTATVEASRASKQQGQPQSEVKSIKKEDLLKPMLNHMFWRPLD